MGGLEKGWVSPADATRAADRSVVNGWHHRQKETRQQEKTVEVVVTKRLMMKVSVTMIVVMTVLFSSQAVTPVGCTDALHKQEERVDLVNRQNLIQMNQHVIDKNGRRVKRQILYFVLNFLGEEGIRSYVESTDTADIPGLMSSVGTDEILYIVSSLPPEEIMRVLTSLPPDDVLTLAGRMTQSQLMQLLGYVPPAGLANLTAAFSPPQLQTLALMLPPEGIVSLAKTLPPMQTKKLMKAMSPGAIFNLTQLMEPSMLVELMTVLPPDIVLDLTQTLSPDQLDRLLKSLPPKVLVTMITSLPPKIISRLITSLPDGFMDSFVKGITPEQLKKMVQNISAEQVAKLMTSIPSTHAPDVSSLLKPEMIGVVMESLPKGLVANLTQIIPAKKMSKMIAAIPADQILSVTSSINSDQMMGLIGEIPPEMMPRLVTAIPPDTLVALIDTLPVDLIVNLTITMARNPRSLRGFLNAMMTPELVGKFSVSLPQRTILEIVDKIPDKTIANITAALPVRRLFELVSSSSLDFPIRDLNELMKDIPSSLVVRVVNAIPPHVIASLSERLSKNQLKKVVRLITPETLKMIVNIIPPNTLARMAQAMPERVVSDVMNVLSPKHFGNLVRAVPTDTIKALLDIALTEDPVQRTPDLIMATTQKVANVLLSVPPETLTRMIKAIPRDVFLSIIQSLPPQAIAEGAAILSGEEGVPIASAFPIEAVAYTMSIIPPETIVKIVDALPQRTIGALANLAMDIPQERVEAFFQHIHVSVLRNIITKLPPRTIEKLVSSLPPETVGKIAQSFSPVTVAPIMDSLRPRELRRLIRSVNTTTLFKMMSSIPPDVLVNLTQSVPSDMISKLMKAVPPEVINQLVSHLDPTGMVSLMKSMPPDVIQNLLTSMPPELIVNMTRILPPAQIQEMMDLLPDEMIGQMVSILPKDVLVNLVQAFDADAMLDMMQKLDPKQLMDILGTLPTQVIVNITKAQTPAQTVKLLDSLPPDGIVNLTHVIPTDTMLDMMQSVPPDALLGLIGSMPLKDLFTLAMQLTPEQTAGMMEQFTQDPDMIPNLLAKVDMGRIMGMVEAVPPELLMQIASSVDMSLVMGLVKRFMPKVQKMLLDKLDDALLQLGRNSTATFQHCLSDLGVVAHGLFNFSEWAIHFFDASGKPARGMFEGNIHMIGNFDQCKKIKHVISGGEREGGVISGSYCHVQFAVPMEALPPVPGDGILPMPEIAMDVCLPDSCQDFDLFRVLKTVSLPMNVTIPRVACQKDMYLSEDPAALIACLFIAIIVLFVVVGTVIDCIFLRRSHTFTDGNKNSMYGAPPQVSNGHTPVLNRATAARHDSNGGTEDDIMAKEKLLFKNEPGAMVEMAEMKMSKKNGGEGLNRDSIAHHNMDHVVVSGKTEPVPDDSLWLRVASAFSVAGNVAGVVSSRQPEDSIRCLHGIRVLSMLWVIFASTVSFSALYFENLLAAANDLVSISSQVILNSSLSQDTFFTVSGVVTAVAFLRLVARSGRLRPGHIAYYYLHRFVRVSPAYILVLVVCALLIGYVADGPHWPPPLQEQCLQQWWTNLLFINNYFVSIEHMCMSWTWFLSNLMQFYWIAPLVLVPFAFRQKIIGFLVVGALVAVHIASVVVLELGINGDILRRQSEYFWVIFQQPYCRVGPFALGLGLGFILTHIKFNCAMHKVTTLVGWALALLTSTTLVLVTYEENRYLLEDAAGWSLATRTVHETLQRPFWALVICWIIFACSTGNGGPVNTVLSWRGFLPLSRLTYCVYLIHPLVIICDLLAYRVFAYFTIGYVLFRYIGYVVVSYILAMVLAVLTEYPAMALERVILSAFSKS